jgi:hypothetical protein
MTTSSNGYGEQYQDKGYAIINDVLANYRTPPNPVFELK